MLNNLKINDINFIYFNKIDEIYISFENSLDNFKEIICLIYKIYYQNDQFEIINNTTKESLRSMLKLLISKNNYFEKYEENFNFNDKQSYINLIQVLLKYNFNISFKDYIISIVQQIDPLLIKNQDVCIYDELYIKNWFTKLNINLNADILNIKDTLIPNFIKLNKSYNLINLDFEFYHLLFKIYKPVIERGFSFYEAGQYNISENDIVFDCGANMGLFAAYAASKGAIVYCFEPMSYTRNYLKEVQNLYPNNIIILPYAIGDNAEIDYFQQMKNPGESKIDNHFNLIDGIYKEKVQIIKLDDFIRDNKIYPTFIKMDIEGSELIALKGCNEFLRTNKPVLSISLDHHNDDKALIPNYINDFGLNYNIFYFNKGECINNSLFMLCK